MDTKINIKSKVILMLIFTVIATISCQTNKEIAHQSDQLDSLSDYSGSSGYFIDDRDGKRYKWVRIGDQIWMAENLAYQADSGCVAFKYKKSKVNKYGYYYSWETAMQTCPKGWHLPTKEEFTLLNNTIAKDSSRLSIRYAFDNFKSGKDFGFNSINEGYYKNINNKFYRYKLLRILRKDYYWTSTMTFGGPYGNPNDSLPFHRFAYLINYHRQVCVFATDDSYNFEDYYFTVRCIKD